MVNRELIQFFSDHFKPGAIGLVGGTDPLSLAIRAAQAGFTADGGRSRWSHSLILGQQRFDRNDYGVVGLSVYVFESTITLNPVKLNVRNGAQENWIGQWCGEETEHAAVVDFGLSLEQTKTVLATALQLVCDQVQYPVDELFRIWWRIVLEGRWNFSSIAMENPHGLVCTGLVRYCYREAERDFLPKTLALNDTTPEHIVKAAQEEGRMVTYESRNRSC